MPAYNAAPFIQEAIDSVRAQTWQDWELIVVDDGSTDATGSILARQGDPRISVIRQTNAGVSAARNAALDVARGEYVTFMDSDDRLPREALIRRVAYLGKYPDVDVVNGAIRVTECGNTITVYAPSTKIHAFFPKIAALEQAFFFGPFYMMRRERIASHRFPQGLSHCEDLCFFLALANDADLVYGAVAEEVYEYRKHADSAMGNLEGIEAGYVALTAFASTLDKMTAARMGAMKWRIASIMLKSWLRKGKPLRALDSVRKVWASGG